MPVARLRARLVSMAAELGITVVVDPAYTSRRGAEHWQKPLSSKNRKTTRHDAAGVAIGRRALGAPRSATASTVSYVAAPGSGPGRATVAAAEVTRSAAPGSTVTDSRSRSPPNGAVIAPTTVTRSHCQILCIDECGRTSQVGRWS